MPRCAARDPLRRYRRCSEVARIVANDRLERALRHRRWAAGSPAISTLSSFVLVGCVLVALWFVRGRSRRCSTTPSLRIPASGRAPSARISSRPIRAGRILALFRNSLVFAPGTALTTFALP